MSWESLHSINPNLRKRHRQLYSTQDYVSGIISGNRALLSQSITLLESTRPEHQQLAQEILEACLPHSSNSVRIGITGTPGVGKSTFIEAFGLHLIAQGRRLAVLAIDPSSQLSKGSILGDKTRMAQLANQQAAFIRPSAASGSLGGVAHKTRETLLLCEAAGYDTILIETVGVGQSETAVRSMVDCFLLLLQPGAGDELQGIKRGIVEMADILAVNKADGERIALAKRAQQEYRNALHLFPAKASNWTPQVLTCSATTGENIPHIWQIIEDFCKFTQANGYFERNRSEQLQHWLYETVEFQLLKQFYQHPSVQEYLPTLSQAVQERHLSVRKAVEKLLSAFLK